ncbi:MAG: hypothetical protein C0621_05935 [Desulfuromonas sp.]|nr:MAG: hypothetical protein C0621_05935 [Desulfuromonas sp.]
MYGWTIRDQKPLVLLLVVLALAVAGCAPPGEKLVGKRFFWPPVWQGEPKFEYIRFVQSDWDVVKGKESWLVEAILGRPEPVPLFTRPMSIAATADGILVVGDSAKRTVLLLDTAKKEIKGFYRSSKQGNSIFTCFPADIDVSSDGEFYVVDPTDKSVYRFNHDGKYLGSFGKDVLDWPTGICVDEKRGRIYVVDSHRHHVVVFDSEGVFVENVVSRVSQDGFFNYPLDVDVDREGNLYVLDAMNARVQVFSAKLEYKNQFGERGTKIGSFQSPKSLTVSPSGLVYVTDARAHRFVVFNTSGQYLLTIGGESMMTDGRVSPGGFYFPQGVYATENDEIWVVDSLNRVVHQLQYLHEDYLEAHPLLPEQLIMEPEMGFSSEKLNDTKEDMR